MVKFRFQDLKIWQLSIQIADELFDLANELEKRKLYRFAEQLRGAGMSMSNNIAEVFRNPTLQQNYAPIKFFGPGAEHGLQYRL